MSEEKKKAPKKPKSKARKIVEWVLTGVFLVIFAILGIGQIDALVHQKDHFGQQLKFGLGTFVVQTESMEKEYMKGDALITQLQSADTLYKDFQAGKTIDLTFWYSSEAYNEVVSSSFAQPTENEYLTELILPPTYPIITHRVMEIHVNEEKKTGEGRYYFITAGINTRSEWMGWQEGQPDMVINQYQAITEKELLGRVVVNSPFLGAVFSFVSSIFGLLILLLIPAFYLVITSVIDIFKAYKEPEPATEGAGGPSNNNNGPVTLSDADKKRLKEQLLEEMISKKKGESHESK